MGSDFFLNPPDRKKRLTVYVVMVCEVCGEQAYGPEVTHCREGWSETDTRDRHEHEVCDECRTAVQAVFHGPSWNMRCPALLTDADRALIALRGKEAIGEG